MVAIDPSAAFAKAIGTNGDVFHTRTTGAVATPRTLRGRTDGCCCCGANTLSPSGWTRLKATFAADDPTGELAATWWVKEQIRRLFGCSSLAQAHEEKMRLGSYVQVSSMAETDRLWDILCRWWPAIEVLLITGVTNAKTEAVNTGIKNIKRTARGFRNEQHYSARILLTSAARSAGWTPITANPHSLGTGKSRQGGRSNECKIVFADRRSTGGIVIHLVQREEPGND